MKDLIAEALIECGRIPSFKSKNFDNCVATFLVEGEIKKSGARRETAEFVYFGPNCNRINVGDIANPSQACDAGYYHFGASPIALIWDQSTGVEDLSKDVRLVSFPIDPHQGDKLVEWKASSKAPLLVYDPSGEGKITSGYQLFGNWTFGPKRVASLRDSYQSAKLWDNGFDALATLDENSDGEVSGVELEHLSLWFDNNRNGISEVGEVRRAASLGVKKLFYKGYANNDSAHAIVLSRGFERERADQTERGVMVDWFAKTASSELEYAQKAMINSALSRDDKTQSGTTESQNPDANNDPKNEKDGPDASSYKKGAAIVSGIWNWSSESNKIPVSGGHFVITDNDDGTVSGLTMIELPVETNIGATSVGSIKDFKGTAKLEDDGSVSFAFELKEKDGTTILQSNAKLQKDGAVMNGTSRGQVRSAAAKTDISYSWVATKGKR